MSKVLFTVLFWCFVVLQLSVVAIKNCIAEQYRGDDGFILVKSQKNNDSRLEYSGSADQRVEDIQLIEEGAVSFDSENNGNADSEEHYMNNKPRYLKHEFYFTFGYENLTQHMGEFLYDYSGQYLASELKWENKYTSIFRVGFEFEPIEKLRLGFIARFSAWDKNNGDFHMRDMDYSYYKNNFTGEISRKQQYSIHPEGKFEYVSLDLFVKYNVFNVGRVNNTGIFKLYVDLGFMYNEIAATQHGKSYFSYKTKYDENADGLKYQQKLFLPYIGVSLEYQYKRFVSVLKFRNSFLNFAKATDWHYNRSDVDNVESYEKHKIFYYYDVAMELGYWFTDYTKVYANFALSQTPKTRKSTDGTNFGVDAKTAHSSFKMSNLSYSFGAGLTIGF